MRIQMFNIDIPRFFAVVDRCGHPVQLCAGDKKSEDIRYNAFLQDLLLSTNPGGKIEQLFISADESDVGNLLRYMMENRITRTR